MSIISWLLEALSPTRENFFPDGTGERVRFNLVKWQTERTSLTKAEVYELNWYDSIR